MIDGRVALLGLGGALALTLGCRGKAAAAGRDADVGAVAVPALDAAVAVNRPPETIVLDEVEVRLHGAADGALVSRELGRELARCLIDGRALVALAQQVPVGRAPRPARLRVEVAAQPAERGGPLTVVMDAQLSWAHGDDVAPSATVTGEATVSGGGVDAAVLAVADRLRDAVCADLAARIEVWGAEDLVPALTGADPAAAHWALVLVADRGAAPGLLDAVVPHLRGEPPLRDAAITALVALGDPRAVPALTELTDLADRAALTTIVEAVIALGGDDARDYLTVMAAHRDPTIADHAREGLARLERRAAPAP